MATTLEISPPLRSESDDDDFMVCCREITIALMANAYTNDSPELQAMGPTPAGAESKQQASSNDAFALIIQRLELHANNFDDIMRRKMQEQQQRDEVGAWDTTIQEFTTRCNHTLSSCRDHITSIGQQVAIVFMNAIQLLQEIRGGSEPIDPGTRLRLEQVERFPGEYFTNSGIRRRIEDHYGSMENLGSGDIPPFDISDVD